MFTFFSLFSAIPLIAYLVIIFVIKVLVPHHPHSDGSNNPKAAPDSPADPRRTYGYASGTSEQPGTTLESSSGHQDRVGGVLGLSVRGRGMFYGLVFKKDAAQAKRVAEHAFSKGLIIELSGSRDEVLKLLPALTIDDNTLVRGLNIIEESIKTLV